MAVWLMPFYVVCTAQIKNASSEMVKIYGNCETCEVIIEKAGNLKNVSIVDWDQHTKMATLTYDAKRTNKDEILKRIALSGFDSDQFLAPDDVYAHLPACCQYERVNKRTTMPMSDHSMHHTTAMTHERTTVAQESNQLQVVFNHYFALKDALVGSDGTLASAKAKSLLEAISAVKMEKLAAEEHVVWMKVREALTTEVKQMEATKDVGLLRERFIALSHNIYELIKVSKQDAPVYYQYCPMANDGEGAHWLSKENAVKNPYFGSQMLTCGKTVETIKE